MTWISFLGTESPVRPLRKARDNVRECFHSLTSSDLLRVETILGSHPMLGVQVEL